MHTEFESVLYWDQHNKIGFFQNICWSHKSTHLDCAPPTFSPEKLLFCWEKGIPEIRLHLLVNSYVYREKKSLRHVAMVAKFLDDNKPKT